MMKSGLRGLIALGCAGLFLFGCKRGETPAPQAQTDEPVQSASSPPPGHDLLKAQHDALDKARAVGGQMQQQAEDQAKAIDAAQK